jgi:hypothetical protein
MNPITTLFHAVRYTNQLNAHIKRVLAARGPIDPAAILASWRERPGSPIGSYLDSPAFESFLDWLEANPSVKWVMISEFDDKRPYTRDDLKDIFLSLSVGGARDWDIMHTFASRSALRYLARAMKRGERHDVIAFTLREHWERGQKLPVELGVKPA